MTTVGEFIRRFRESRSLSQQKVGEAIGYSGQSARQKIYRVERGDEDLSATQLTDLIRKFDIDPTALLELGLEIPAERARTRGTSTKMRDDFDEFIPVVSFEGGAESSIKRVVGAKPRPPSLRDVRDAYAIYAPDNSMEPRYRRGWLLWVNPGKPASEGRDALMYPKDGLPVVRQLARCSNGALVGKPLSGNGPSFREDEVTALHLIVGVDQEG